MSDDWTKGSGVGHYASPPCMAHEVDPAYFDPLAVDPQQARDVARWRKAERSRLLAQRRAMSTETLRSNSQALAEHLRRILTERIGDRRGGVVSLYWPIRSEPDLRGLMPLLIARGLRVALPVVETKAAPLVFREWTPQTQMMRGDWNIPVPPTDAVVLRPDIALAPLVGWDDGGYRLGYGGGYFDRTLAALQPRPFVIGVGYQAARLGTIYPQPHDIAMDVIVTEAGPQPIARP